MRRIAIQPADTETFKVIRRVTYKTRKPCWECLCKRCGNVVIKDTQSIKVLKSCGTQCTHFKAGQKKITFQGKSLKKLSEETGIHVETLASRIRIWGMCDEVVRRPLNSRQRMNARTRNAEQRKRILANKPVKTSELAFYLVHKAFEHESWVEIDKAVGMHSGWTTGALNCWLDGAGTLEQLTDMLECSEEAELPYLVREKVKMAFDASNLNGREFVELIFDIRGPNIYKFLERKNFFFRLIDKFCEAYKVKPETFLFCDMDQWQKIIKGKRR